jgi:hypothetical protein
MNEFQNPYAAPISQHRPDEVDSKSFEPAGQGARLLNLVIDYFAQFVIAFVLGIAFALIGGEDGIAFLEGIPDFFLGIPILLLYYIILKRLHRVLWVSL